MADFTISLAGIPVGITLGHPESRWFFEEYISGETPAFCVAATEQDLNYEREYVDDINRGDAGEAIVFSDQTLEVNAILRRIASRLPEYDTVLFHGSAVASGGRAYVFAARSGVGKTTHTRLWLEQIPDTHVLNGDKPFLRVQADGSVLACGVPWKGKEKLGRNEKLPLEAICLLERAAENEIRRITPKEAIDVLVRQVYIPRELSGKIRTLQLLDRICRGVRLYRLGCNMEAEAALVSAGAMIPKG